MKTQSSRTKTARPGTGPVYSGDLCWGDRPACGEYDFLLAFCDAPGPEGAVRAVVERLSVAVENGRYALTLSADEASLGPGPVWLAVAVRPTGSVGAYLRLPGKQLVEAPPRSESSRAFRGRA